jgi:outer membrane lipoprotein-sorting protein
MKTVAVLLVSCLLAAPLLVEGAASTPTVEELLEKYVAAIGGKAAWEKLTSRFVKGTQEYVGGGSTDPVEIYMKAPNSSLIVANTLDGVSREGFDGSAGWVKFAEEPVRDMNKEELSWARGNSAFYRELHLKDFYAEMKVTGTEKVKGRDAWVVEAKPKEGSPERLYFDSSSGLLLQRNYLGNTWQGPTEIWAFYEDYRDVDGIKLPFTIRQVNSDIILRIAEVQHNVPLEEAKFKKPSN